MMTIDLFLNKIYLLFRYYRLRIFRKSLADMPISPAFFLKSSLDNIEKSNTFYSGTSLIQVGVKVILRNVDRKFLLVRRNTDKYTDMKSTFDIPGGRIDIGSDLMANLKRELLEETGMSMSSVPRLICAQDILRADKHVVRLTYFADTTDTRVVLDASENTEYKWAHLEEIFAMEDLDTFAYEGFKNYCDQTFPKLVRDEYPKFFENKGIKMDFDVAEDKVSMLKNKIQEEAIEVKEASSKDELLEELADLKEVYDSLLEEIGLNLEDIEEVAKIKRVKYGSFKKGIIAKNPTKKHLKI